MTSVLQLLTLPANSKGFTAIPQSITDTEPSRNSQSDPLSPRGSSQPVKIQITGQASTGRSNSTRPNLQQIIKRLLTRNNDSLPATYEAIYGECFSVVCVQNTGEGLYTNLKLELEQAVSRRLSKDLSSLTKKTDDADVAVAWIKEFVETCKWFETQVALLESLLTYLDQVYIQRAQVLSIRKLAFSLFVRSIFENPELMNTLRNAVKTLITTERQLRMTVTYTKDFPSLISHLYTHQQYSVFEEFYRDITWRHYEEESRAAAEKKSPKDFFEHVQGLLSDEVDRSIELLAAGSWGIIRDATLKALLTGRMKWIAENSEYPVGDYLDRRDFKSLRTMNELFSDAEGDKVICGAFKSHVQKTVQTIVKDASADDTMVQRLLESHATADIAIKKCFLEAPVKTGTSKTASTSSVPLKRPRQEFIYALSDAFAVGFRARRNKVAEMIARHLDKLMRKGQGAMTDGEFDALLNQALGLYRFTDDKDVFRGFYLRALAKRLLLEKSASHDFEASVLKKLKDDYDPEFSLGGEMFSDLALSRDAMVEYQNKLPSESEGHKLSVMVLKQGAWPYSRQDQGETRLPPNMQEELDAFAKFYKDKHTGRALNWQPSVGTVTMAGHFKAGKKELSVSLFQAAVLLLFNRSFELSFSEIFEETKRQPKRNPITNEMETTDHLDGPLLRLTLQSLACGKKKVLLKIPAGRDINDGDVFRFNDGFSDPRAKVHINSIQAKVTAEESKQTQTAIDGERSASLDAAIVRIMKAKKEMVYEKLVNATIDAVKSHFTPDVKTIKTRIDKLMEQEYVRRDDDKPQMLFYVA
ncbi:Cullin family-domain-containing protein [Mycena alexandri]|uniref:Cullin family-domain-containing protein n=1 Tax=Mycena alexandri TaxID=1745969 RepID=A0AAD6TAR2_9AGAR|nr:Cullin family-domain-containing protein [Mycena alexandri]